MPDDKSKTGKPDDTRINVNQPHEVQYWSGKLNVSPEKLKETVREVGPMVQDVKRRLGR